MINLGSNTISNIMLGNTQVQKMYFGTNLIWENNPSRLSNGATFESEQAI